MSGPDPAPGGVDEFDLIERLLRPLAADAPEALGLTDDAAVLSPRPGCDLVISKDALVAGVHFLPGDPLDLVARKALRVNLSDLAAMGAEPYAYLLAAAWPADLGWPGREAFAEGLRQDQAEFGLKLLGGDTVSTPGPLTLSVTILGWVRTGQAILRSGAKVGDYLLVSGTIGDGWLGLQAAQGRLEGLAPPALDYLADRYRLPQPRVLLGRAIAGLAHAAADVSDGLAADALRVADASGLAVEIDLDALPLSDAAAAWLETQPDRPAAMAALATGGDDYEIVCAAPPSATPVLLQVARQAGTPLTTIGRLTSGQGARAFWAGKDAPLRRLGFRHD